MEATHPYAIKKQRKKCPYYLNGSFPMSVLAPDDVPDDVAEEEGGVRLGRVPGGGRGDAGRVGAVDGEVDHLHLKYFQGGGQSLTGERHAASLLPPSFYLHSTCPPPSKTRSNCQTSELNIIQSILGILLNELIILV